MSRPPRPHTGPPISGEVTFRPNELDYLPQEHADFVEDALDFAAGEHGLVTPGGEGDFARSLVDLSALLAHVLGVYQDRFAGEAFLGTAHSGRSLVRHARRLAYEPDPGLAATGFLHLRIHEGLEGTIPEGFAVSSTSKGEKKAQDYETLHDQYVSARHNEIDLDAAQVQVTLSGSSIRVQGTGLQLEPGDAFVVMKGEALAFGGLVKDASEDQGHTVISVNGSLPAIAVGSEHVFLAKPALKLRMLGFDAPAEVFSKSDLTSGAWAEPNGGSHDTAAGYEVPGHAADELLLVPAPDRSLLKDALLRIDGSPQAYTVTAERSVVASIKKRIFVEGKTLSVGSDGKATASPVWNSVDYSAGGAVAGVKLSPAVTRTDIDPREAVFAGQWSLRAPLVATLPSQAPAGAKVVLAGLYPKLAPGDRVLLCTRDDRVREIADVVRTETTTRADGTPGTELSFRTIDADPAAHAWTRGDLVVRGNVARISHGASTEEVLGDSDGVTPFLTFELSKKPLTWVPGARSAEPALEVRVAGVRWLHVPDFYDSGAEDRHYVLRRDEEGATTVRFGNGKRGAVPPSGKRHITARYRIGLGAVGDADSDEVHRIKKAHPLVERAYDPRAVRGGADAARLEDVRIQATRYIRTFDRAVSVQDHADLALLFPGVARASARWTPLGATEGIQVIAADARGESLGANANTSLRGFLDARRDTEIPMEVRGPEPVDVHLTVTLEFDPDFLPERVKLSVRDALMGESVDAPGLFTFGGRALGQPAFLSEIYERLTGVRGVTFVQIDAFHVAGAPAVKDVVRIAPHQWLRLTAAKLQFGGAA